MDKLTAATAAAALQMDAVEDYARRGRTHSRLSQRDLEDLFVESFALFAEDITDVISAELTEDYRSEMTLRNIEVPHERIAGYQIQILAAVSEMVKTSNQVLASLERMAFVVDAEKPLKN